MALGLISKIRGLRETVGIDVGHYSIKYVKVLHGASGNKIVLDADLERVPDGCIVNGEIQVREGDAPTDQDGISFDIYRKSEEDDGFLKAGSSASGVFTDNSVAFNRSYTYYIEAEEPGHYSGSDRSGEVTARAYVAVTGISCRAYDPYDLVLSPGKSLYLHAAPVPTDASFPKMLWSSEDPGIASVSAEGKVTAVSPGTTKILIRSEDESYQGSESYEVNVVPPEKCGDDLYWYFDSDSKALVIFGEGDMYDFTGNSFPWFSKRFNIEKIVFSESVTGTPHFLMNALKSAIGIISRSKRS